MSTLLRKNIEEFLGARGRLPGGGQVCCALCRGELYPGDYYFWLEERRVCEACLERYAQQYFAHQRRRLSASEREVR